jgi:hypothetical protein
MARTSSAPGSLFSNQTSYQEKSPYRVIKEDGGSCYEHSHAHDFVQLQRVSGLVWLLKGRGFDSTISESVKSIFRLMPLVHFLRSRRHGKHIKTRCRELDTNPQVAFLESLKHRRPLLQLTSKGNPGGLGTTDFPICGFVTLRCLLVQTFCSSRHNMRV